MSKAADYAHAIKEVELKIRPEFRAHISRDRVARVTSSGNLEVFYGRQMTPDLALALADWIYATFGEGK